MEDPKRPLLSFTAENADALSKFQRLILEEASRRDEETAASLRAMIAEVRASARKEALDMFVGSAKLSLQFDALSDRVAHLERAVKRLERPRSGISGLFRRPE